MGKLFLTSLVLLISSFSYGQGASEVIPDKDDVTALNAHMKSAGLANSSAPEFPTSVSACNNIQLDQFVPQTGSSAYFNYWREYKQQDIVAKAVSRGADKFYKDNCKSIDSPYKFLKRFEDNCFSNCTSAVTPPADQQFEPPQHCGKLCLESKIKMDGYFRGFERGQNSVNCSNTVTGTQKGTSRH